jgi:hypothetical protein
MNVSAQLTRSYTPLAFREQTERWVVFTLAFIVAVVWLVVIPLEIVLYERNRPDSPPAAPARVARI